MTGIPELVRVTPPEVICTAWPWRKVPITHGPVRVDHRQMLSLLAA